MDPLDNPRSTAAPATYSSSHLPLNEDQIHRPHDGGTDNAKTYLETEEPDLPWSIPTVRVSNGATTMFIFALVRTQFKLNSGALDIVCASIYGGAEGRSVVSYCGHHQELQ